MHGATFPRWIGCSKHDGTRHAFGSACAHAAEHRFAPLHPSPVGSGRQGESSALRQQPGDLAQSTRYLPHPYTEADAQFWLEHTKANFNDLAIQFEGEAVGGVGVIPQQAVAEKTARFGYWLAEPMWGRGIATAAARAMTSYAFETMPFWRLEATVFAWNPASMRVLEKAGFSREGVLRKSAFKDGELIDSVMYAKIREA
jgi:[ribosomal protein S5]-alanine N-acetyltransferase